MPSNLFRIASITARQILDSRGRPTVEADVVLESGAFGRASAPSGASTGAHEAHELRDGDMAVAEGLGVSRAVENISGDIRSALLQLDARDQRAIDNKMIEADGSSNLGRLGANAILATSLAVCRAAAEGASMPLYRYINGLVEGRRMTLPLPMTNILSGGAHAGRGMDIQDFLVVPVGASDYPEALAWVNKVRQAAMVLCSERGLPVLLADEGGLSPMFRDPHEALDLMVESIVAAGLSPGRDVAIALDIASTEFFRDGLYHLSRQDRQLTSAEMVTFVKSLVDQYPIISVEDPLAEDDWDGWQVITTEIPQCQLLGDDLFVTNPTRIKRGKDTGVANAALIKVNQNGTLSGTLDAMRVAWDAGYATIVSARSGETEDNFIADLAVGTGAGQIKIGSTRNSERLSKYNQLLRICQQDKLPFAKMDGFAGARVGTLVQG
jgi:enolase